MSRHRSLAFAALAAVWLLGLQGLGIEATGAYLTPGLLILLPLLGGRYPGDRALARVVARRAPTRRRGRILSTPMRRPRPEAPMPRGGRLVGTALAGRAPPAPRCV